MQLTFAGEIIQMSNSMNMIFEVQDLAVASPATVSRCGMVYVEPEQLGWRPLRDSWINTLPGCLQEHSQRLFKLFEWLLDPCIAFVRKNCYESVPTSDINLAQSLMRLLWSSLDEFRSKQDDQVLIEIQTYEYETFPLRLYTICSSLFVFNCFLAATVCRRCLRTLSECWMACLYFR